MAALYEASGVLELLFSHSQFTPHLHHFADTPYLAGVIIVANILTAVAYFTIPAAIFYFVRRRPDLAQYHNLYLLFAAFIFACGMHHTAHTISFWYPFYYIEAIIDAVTAFVSVGAAIVVWFVLPDLLRAPSIRQYVQTQQLLYEREREVAQQKELEQWREDFTSATSHELRNPLSAQQLTLELLALSVRTKDAEKCGELVNDLMHHSKRIQQICDDLADTTNAHRSSLRYSFAPGDLMLLITRVKKYITQESDAHRIVIKGRLRRPVSMDAMRIEQVLNNVLKNAFKYAPGSGRIEIRVSETEHGARVCIKDQGPGIPLELQEAIFERFYRAPTVRNSGVPGLGIGLYLSRRIIEDHGGTLTLVSAPGAGSTFCFTVPYAKAESSA